MTLAQIHRLRRSLLDDGVLKPRVFSYQLRCNVGVRSLSYTITISMEKIASEKKNGVGRKQFASNIVSLFVARVLIKLN